MNSLKKIITVLSIFNCSILLLSSLNCVQRKKELGNVYRFASYGKIKGFDPALSSDEVSNSAIKQIYEPLLQYHYLKRPYELEPLIAESLPQISEDKVTYTFKLQKGVFFQEDPCFKGKKRELTANDAVYSFKRLADIKIKSTGWWIFDGRIKGLNDFRDKNIDTEKTDYSIPVEGLQAPDKYTLIIELTKPCPQMLFFLALSYTSIVCKEVVDYYGKEFINHPVGTGPYILSEWRKGLRLVYRKNPDFRKMYYPSEGSEHDKENGLLNDSGKQIPFIDTVIIKIFSESQPQWLNFLKANLDISGIPKDNYNQAITPDKSLTKELVDKGITLSINPSMDITYTFFNMEDKIIGSNIHIRRAMCLAQDINKSIDLLYNNRAIPAHSQIPPGLLGYDKNYINPYQKYDVDLAKKELVKAGYPQGKDLPSFEFLTTDNTTSRQFSEKFINEMSVIGIKISPISVNWPEFLNRIKNKKFQIASMGWGADYPDPENFVQLLYGPNEAPGTNNANYKNPEYDSLYEKLILTKDIHEKGKILKRMKDIFANDCPWMPGVHRLAYSLRYKWLKNYKYADISGAQADVKYRRIDVEMRNKMLKGN